jgi:hypothetical protein
LFLVASSAFGPAAPRSSTNYAIAVEATNSGGRRVTSANYTNDGSAGLVAGISSVAVPAAIAKHGYVAQLFDVTGLVVNATAASVDENATLQLAAWQLLDDATFFAVTPTAVSWSVVSGPIAGIDAAGLLTAGSVYQDTPASVQGTLGPFIGSLNLTVFDTIADNFGLYAGDGLPDNWHVQYFGENNPLAAPGLDPDGDGQTNAFEFTAGLVPTDATSVFRLRIAAVPGQSNHKQLVFHPRLADRGYVVKFKTDLVSGIWQPLPAFTFSDTGPERTVTDLSATGAREFYQVEITRP